MKRSDSSRFDSKWVKVGDCHIWQAGKNSTGYGQFWVGGRGGKNLLAHRYAKSRELGRELLPSEVVRHSCDTPACVNPDHLLEGTQADNIADRDAKGRQHRKYTEEQVQEIKALYAQGLSQTAIARQTGASRPYISEVLSGKYRRTS